MVWRVDEIGLICVTYNCGALNNNREGEMARWSNQLVSGLVLLLLTARLG